MKRVLSQFSPHDFTAFKWGTASDFLHYFTVVLLLFVFLAAELNPFYLKVSDAPLNTPGNLGFTNSLFSIEFIMDGTRSPGYHSPSDFRVPKWLACGTGIVSIYQRSEVGLIFYID